MTPERKKRYYDRNRERYKEIMRERYHRLRESHRCVMCTCELPEGWTLCKCPYCNTKMKIQARERRLNRNER